jgi:putative membrane protein
MTDNQKLYIAVFIALLFHISGAIGILCTPYRDWFIQNTPLNLFLMAVLVLFTQPTRNKAFFIFAATCFITGMVAEAIGVNTGWLFGNYVYGAVMGFQIAGVPLLIGLYWFITVFGAATTIRKLNHWAYTKMTGDTPPSARVMVFAYVADAALLTTFFDWVMEPVATELGFWKWLPDGNIPFYNYACWFIISALLVLLFNKLCFKQDNQFAVHLFIIQLLFFLVLQSFL